jgi:hypothetical protein
VSTTAQVLANVSAADIPAQAFKNGTLPLMARVYDQAGQLLTQAAVTSIAYSIYELDDDDPDVRGAVAGHAAVSLTKTDVIFNTLQTDALWASDTTGYNFRHTPPIGTSQAFAKAGRHYLVEYRITPSAAGRHVIIVRLWVSVI